MEVDFWTAEGGIVAVDAGADVAVDADDIDNVFDADTEDAEDTAVAKVSEADSELDKDNDDTCVLDVEEGEDVDVLFTEGRDAAGEEVYTAVIDASGSIDDGIGVSKEEGSSSLIIDETSRPRSSETIAGSDRLGKREEVKAVDGDGTGVRTNAV